MNRTISRAIAMLDSGKTLADVRKFLDPFGNCPNLEKHNPVVREAWHAALHRAKHPKPAKKPKPQKAAVVVRKARTTRADRRNAMFGRNTIGNRRATT